MKIYKNPVKKNWPNLIQRPTISYDSIEPLAKKIFNDVSINGDIAILKYTSKFDNVDLSSLEVNKAEFDSANTNISSVLKNAIKVAKKNIYTFHKAQVTPDVYTETQKGVNCWKKKVAIERVGLYIPGGTAPLFSTVLMLAIPAKIAGCKNIILCSPPNEKGKISDEILYAASICGVNRVYKVGGIQSIAAMTFGSKTIDKVDKIFGPGNQFVTIAKLLATKYNVSIDMPAGPSELMVVSDNSGRSDFIASDLLSQAEHGEDSQVILVTNSEKLANDTLKEVQKQSKKLNRFQTIEKVLKNSKIILLDNEDELIKFSNFYGPEHLIICLKNKDLIDKIVNAGSVFIGNYSAESIGDYASGTNHTLPTNGYARQYSGVNLDSFLKSITYQEISEKGILNIGPIVEILSNAEGLEAHKKAVSIRLKYIKNKG